MSKRLRDYETLQVHGVNPLQCYQVLKRQGKQHMECLKAIRGLYPLSLAEAKEVMIIGEGQADSLDEHQQALADELNKALAELDGTQS